MKINIGCGRRVLDGWVNCDVQANPKAPRPPEHICDARDIPLPDECAEVVQALHLIEHFYVWEVSDVLMEWRRVLKPGGRLILELPNLEHACRNLLKGKGDQMAMWPLYGDPGHKDPFMCHRWGYTPRTIEDLLAAHSFRDVAILHPRTHGRRVDRDMRVESVK